LHRIYLGMFVASFPDENLDIQIFAQTCLKLPQAEFNFSPQFRKFTDALKQFVPEHLLRRIR